MSTVQDLGWAGTKNGVLLRRAADLCDVFVSMDGEHRAPAEHHPPFVRCGRGGRPVESDGGSGARRSRPASGEHCVFFDSHGLARDSIERAEVLALLAFLGMQPVSAPDGSADGEVWVRLDERLDAELDRWA